MSQRASSTYGEEFPTLVTRVSVLPLPPCPNISKVYFAHFPTLLRIANRRYCNFAEFGPPPKTSQIYGFFLQWSRLSFAPRPRPYLRGGGPLLRPNLKISKNLGMYLSLSSGKHPVFISLIFFYRLILWFFQPFLNDNAPSFHQKYHKYRDFFSTETVYRLPRRVGRTSWVGDLCVIKISEFLRILGRFVPRIPKLRKTPCLYFIHLLIA